MYVFIKIIIYACIYTHKSVCICRYMYICVCIHVYIKKIKNTPPTIGSHRGKHHLAMTWNANV